MGVTLVFGHIPLTIVTIQSVVDGNRTDCKCVTLKFPVYWFFRGSYNVNSHRSCITRVTQCTTEAAWDAGGAGDNGAEQGRQRRTKLDMTRVNRETFDDGERKLYRRQRIRRQFQRPVRRTGLGRQPKRPARRCGSDSVP